MFVIEVIVGGGVIQECVILGGVKGGQNIRAAVSDCIKLYLRNWAVNVFTSASPVLYCA